MEAAESPYRSTTISVVSSKKQRLDGFCEKIHSARFRIYWSHILSAWGDRMWSFAFGLYLVWFGQMSLQLAAIYGLIRATFIFLFGAFIGEWIDKNPRLKVARTSLLLQNSCVILCVVVLALIFKHEHIVRTLWGGWLSVLCLAMLMLFALVAAMSSVATQIAIQRDWIVVIAADDKDLLASMNAMLRRIDLTTNILAPAVVGQIMTYGSLFIGATFIGGWNIVSMVIEYTLLVKVYKSTPALAIKGGDVNTVRQREHEALCDGSGPPSLAPSSQDLSRVDLFDIDIDHCDSSDDDLSKSKESLKAPLSKSKSHKVSPTISISSRSSKSGSLEHHQPGSKPASEDPQGSGGHMNDGSDSASQPSYSRLRANDIDEVELELSKVEAKIYKPKSSDADRHLRTGGSGSLKRHRSGSRESIPSRRSSMSSKRGSVQGSFSNIITAPRASADNISPDLSPEGTNCLQCCRTGTVKVCGRLMALYRGWGTYKKYTISLAGVALALLYMTVLGFDSITVGYSYSRGLSESLLGASMAAGSIAGILGTIAYPKIRKHSGLERTGIVAICCQMACNLLCVVAIWLPYGAYYDWQTWINHQDPDTNIVTVTTADYSGSVLNVTTMPSSVLNVSSSTSEPEPEIPKHHLIPVIVFLLGVVLARFGLWMFDLTVTQLLQETVLETERGVIGGVQSSLNNLFDMLHFILVIVLPNPETFWFLILVSIFFVFFGAVMYFSYTYRILGSSLHIDKILQCCGRSYIPLWRRNTGLSSHPSTTPVDSEPSTSTNPI